MSTLLAFQDSFFNKQHDKVILKSIGFLVINQCSLS